MNIVIDIEFYHNSKRDTLGPIKQIGAFKFDDKYQIIDVFEMTVTKYTPIMLIKQLFKPFVTDVEQVFLWAAANDKRVLQEALDVDLDNFSLIDVQTYFKDVNLASLTTISQALEYDNEGRHNALVDAEYTFEIIKHFDLLDEVSRSAIGKYIDLIRIKEVNPDKVIETIASNEAKGDVKKQKTDSKKSKVESKASLKVINPGSLRKLNDEYYQITSAKVIEETIKRISDNNLFVSQDGDFKLPLDLGLNVKENSSIIFSNTNKFKTIASKYEQKLIFVVDSEGEVLSIFLSRKAYKKFIK